MYAGIDLHSNNNVLAVLDEHDAVLRQRRLPNGLPIALMEVERFRDELAGHPVESTCNGYWLVDDRSSRVSWMACVDLIGVEASPAGEQGSGAFPGRGK